MACSAAFAVLLVLAVAVILGHRAGPARPATSRAGTARRAYGPCQNGPRAWHSAQAQARGPSFGPCQPDQPGENIGPGQPTAHDSVNTPANSALPLVFKFGIKIHRKHNEKVITDSQSQLTITDSHSALTDSQVTTHNHKIIMHKQDLKR
jgi:hypothetical protein